MRIPFLAAGFTAAILTLTLWSASALAAQDGHRDDRGGPERWQRDGHGSDSHARRAPDYPRRYPPVGREIRSWPSHYDDLRVGRQSYRYYGGVFYRPRPDGVYVVVRPPLGARVRYLPPGYVSFGIGPSRYFYFDATYYLWDEPRREYVVVQEPAGAAPALTAAASTSGELFIYPNRGQSDEQRERDRYDCYLWASDQTGFDPGATEPQYDKAGDYRRAMSACMEGRGYTVR